jgi:pimeloyl-ACP methyl ester carboxylesterase
MGDDEFALLAEEATEFGLDPRARVVHRVTLARGTAGAGAAGQIDALVWGEGRAELAMLHGGGLNAHTWDAFALAFDRPLLAVDLPGHGGSSWRDDADYRPETNAAALAPVLAELAPLAQAVVGQSLGGLTAIALLATYPELVRRLVVIDVTPGLRIEGANQVRDFLAGPDSFESRHEIVDRALSFGFGPSRRALERGVFHNTRRREDGRYVFKHHLANLRRGVDAGADGVDLPSEAAPVFATDFTGLWSALESIKVPVLLVRGSRGFLSDEVAAEFTDRVRGARTVTIESGHNVQEDAPVELARVVSEFIAS